MCNCNWPQIWQGDKKAFTQRNSMPENKENKLKKINYTPSTNWPAVASSCAVWLLGTQGQPTDLF